MLLDLINRGNLYIFVGGDVNEGYFLMSSHAQACQYACADGAVKNTLKDAIVSCIFS